VLTVKVLILTTFISNFKEIVLHQELWSKFFENFETFSTFYNFVRTHQSVHVKLLKDNACSIITYNMIWNNRRNRGISRDDISNRDKRYETRRIRNGKRNLLLIWDAESVHLSTRVSRALTEQDRLGGGRKRRASNSYGILQ